MISSIVGSPQSSPFNKKLSSSIPAGIPSIFLSDGPSLMVQRAIASAERQGLTLIPGRANPASGNCAFEAPIFNLNDRTCFLENLPMSIDYYRRIWVTDMENRLFESPYNPGYTRNEWNAGWEKLKVDNVYEVDFFGDLVVPAIACGIRKNVLIFNTNCNHPRTPISVIFPSQYGVEATSRIPIILAYDMSHYESLHPADACAIENSINLVNSFKEGQYELTYKDLEALVSLDFQVETSLIQVGRVKHAANIESREDLDKITNQIKITKIPIQKKMKLTEAMKSEGNEKKKRKVLKVRDMSDDERKAYKKEQQAAYRAKKREEDPIKFKEAIARGRSSQRAKKREQDPVEFRETIATEKASQRDKKMEQDPNHFKEAIASQKSSQRGKKKEQDPVDFHEAIAAEKASQRDKKREQDPHHFKEATASQKSSQRAKKKEQDPDEFSEAIAGEKASQRDKKRKENPTKYKENMRNEQQKTREKKVDTGEKRRNIFKKSIKDGRIY